VVNNPSEDWEKFGKEDPYFGVIDLERFHKTNLTPEAITEFFDSGQKHIEYVLGTIRSHIDPAYQPKVALDFGCGVGRCTIPIAKLCERVTGVDVSPSMIEEGKSNALSQAVRNIEWINSGDLQTVSGEFDFIHSFIVFQHIPPIKGMDLLSRLIDLLAADGIASIQLLYYKDSSRLKQILGRIRVSVPFVHNFANLYYGKPFTYPLMQKNVYDLNAVLNLLHKKGCGNCVVRFGETGGEHQEAMIFFMKRRDAIPYFQFYNLAQDAASANTG
jgi:SAM-dependent methyltransferase